MGTYHQANKLPHPMSKILCTDAESNKFFFGCPNPLSSSEDDDDECIWCHGNSTRASDRLCDTCREEEKKQMDLSDEEESEESEEEDDCCGPPQESQKPTHSPPQVPSASNTSKHPSTLEGWCAELESAVQGMKHKFELEKQTMRGELEAKQAELEATKTELQATRAELEATKLKAELEANKAKVEPYVDTRASKRRRKGH